MTSSYGDLPDYRTLDTVTHLSSSRSSRPRHRELSGFRPGDNVILEPIDLTPLKNVQKRFRQKPGDLPGHGTVGESFQLSASRLPMSIVTVFL